MRYRLLALDLDGTLLNEHGRVSPANRDAVRELRRRGVMTVPCTGRGWTESKDPIAAIFDGVALKNGSPQVGSPGVGSPHAASAAAPCVAADVGTAACPGVFISGAVVADVCTGQAMDLAVIEPHLCWRIVESLRDLPEAVLVFRELSMVGHDYLITGEGSLTAQTQWWFQRSGATVHFQRTVTPDDLRHSLRVAVVAADHRMEIAKERVRKAVGDAVYFHSFEAQQPEPKDVMHILEIFAAGVDKWRGIEWIAQTHGIATREVAVIGDEINDLTMMRTAGCGIAMGNAIRQIKACAKHVTRDNRSDGVAHAIEQLLSGAWV